MTARFERSVARIGRGNVTAGRQALRAIDDAVRKWREWLAGATTTQELRDAFRRGYLAFTQETAEGIWESAVGASTDALVALQQSLDAAGIEGVDLLGVLQNVASSRAGYGLVADAAQRIGGSWSKTPGENIWTFDPYAVERQSNVLFAAASREEVSLSRLRRDFAALVGGNDIDYARYGLDRTDLTALRTTEYRARRVAATETVTAARDSLLGGLDQAGVTAATWTLSPFHPEEDECDELAGQLFPLDDWPETHPFCMCQPGPPFEFAGGEEVFGQEPGQLLAPEEELGPAATMFAQQPPPAAGTWMEDAAKLRSVLPKAYFESGQTAAAYIEGGGDPNRSKVSAYMKALGEATGSQARGYAPYEFLWGSAGTWNPETAILSLEPGESDGLLAYLAGERTPDAYYGMKVYLHELGHSLSGKPKGEYSMLAHFLEEGLNEARVHRILPEVWDAAIPKFEERFRSYRNIVPMMETLERWSPGFLDKAWREDTAGRSLLIRDLVSEKIGTVMDLAGLPETETLAFRRLLDERWTSGSPYNLSIQDQLGEMYKQRTFRTDNPITWLDRLERALRQGQHYESADILDGLRYYLFEDSRGRPVMPKVGR